MDWPTKAHPVPLTELGWVNTAYLSGGAPRSDPMIVWGTTVETGPLEAFLASEGRKSGLILSPAHLLIAAVARSLRQHSELNRRVLGRRVYRYDGVNVVIPMLQTRGGEVDVLYLRNAGEMSLVEIARSLWDAARHKALDTVARARREKEGTWLKNTLARLGHEARLRWIHTMARVGFAITNWLRLPNLGIWMQELNGANAFVNFLGFPGAPPMISYKPSCLPTSSFSVSVTMGLAENKPVVVDNAIVIRKLAPLFVRMDHRMINGHQAAAFINTLRTLLVNPATLLDMDEIGIERAA